MVFYYGKRFNSAIGGTRVAGVECDKCGCSYFYELARVGSGGASAPYGIGASSAANSAREQSQADLVARLTQDAELVPCPECHWISDELIQAYRRMRYAGLGWLAAGIAGFGSLISMFVAWFIALGPPADRVSMPYFLVGGLLASTSLALLAIALRTWMRRRIRPNQNFPLPPQLPPGSPPALVEDPASGQLAPAVTTSREVVATSDWFDFQIGRHSLPDVCCECLRAAEPKHVYKREVAASIYLEIPRCGQCAGRSSRKFHFAWWSSATVMLLGGAGVLSALESTEFWILYGAYVLMSLAFVSYIAVSLTVPVKFGGGDPSRGIVRMKFRNTQYQSAIEQA